MGEGVLLMCPIGLSMFICRQHTCFPFAYTNKCSYQLHAKRPRKRMELPTWP